MPANSRGGRHACLSHVPEESIRLKAAVLVDGAM